MNKTPTQPGAWKQAVVDYMNTLSPAQQLKFKAPTTVDDCIQILKEHRSRKKAFTRILRFFEPLIEPLKRFEGVIDVLVQTNAGIGSPIWGPLRLAMTIASDHFKTLERLAFIIDKVASSVKRYHDFEKLFNTHDDVRNAIGALYSDLICFCTRLVRFHTKPIRYLVSFDREFGSISESINFHSDEVHRAAYLAHIKEEKNAREKMDHDKQTEHLHRLQCWLSPSTVEDDLHKHLKEHMDGSTDWIITSKEFSIWLHGHSNDSLQITGRPGSGKSTLAAFLVQHLSKTYPSVLYFFCDSDDSEKRETIYILRTLLAQLLKIDPGVQHEISPLYHRSGRTIAGSSYGVSQAFDAAMKRQQGNDILIVIDAVDECRDATSYNGLLCQLQSSTRDTKVKVAMTTRAQANNGTGWSPTYDLTMTPDFSSHHIYEYVKRRVQRLGPIANTNFAYQVIEQIAKSSDGLWLYARLMVDEVERAPSKERVKRCLETPPRGLSNLYDQILRSREARMTEDQQEFAKNLYIWLHVSDYMPSFLAADFDRLPYRMLQLIFRYVNGGNEVFNAETLARELGTPLIEIYEIDSTYEIEFVHRTAYTFLDSQSGLLSHELPLVLRPQRLKRLHRGITAVWYFTECSESEKQLEVLKSRSHLGELISCDSIPSYFEMAYGLLDTFKLRKIPENLSQEESEDVKALLKRLTEFIRAGEFLRYFEMSTIINYSGNFVQLLDNVLEVLLSAQKTSYGTDTITEFTEFCTQREKFFRTWECILYETTPWHNRWQGYRTKRVKPSMINGFENTTVMMEIAKKWGNVFFEGYSNTNPVPESLHLYERGEEAERLISHSRLVLCPHCARAIHGSGFKKHEWMCKRQNNSQSGI